MSSNPKYNVDIQALTQIQSSTTSNNSKLNKEQQKETLAKLTLSKQQTQLQKMPFKTNKSKEKEDKALNETLTFTDTAALLSALDSTPIPVYYKTTGIALPADKWPTLSNICTWLDKNNECNVQSTYAAILKVF